MGAAERWQRFARLPQGIERRLAELMHLFEREQVRLVYLFGSTSRGHVGQDLDLAILGDEQPAFKLREAIAQTLGAERIDLVDLRRASPVLRFEIIRTGRVLYAANDEVQDRFEMETIHLYRDTAHLRRQQGKYLRERMAGWHSDAR